MINHKREKQCAQCDVNGMMEGKKEPDRISHFEWSIANKVITNGTSSVFRFISYAQKLGFNTKYQSKTIEEIKELLRENVPVIAVQNYSLNIDI